MIPSLRFKGLDFAPQLFPFSNLAVAPAGAKGLASSTGTQGLNTISGIESPIGLTLRSTRFS